jgi:hypothetical protein
LVRVQRRCSKCAMSERADLSRSLCKISHYHSHYCFVSRGRSPRSANRS